VTGVRLTPFGNVAPPPWSGDWGRPYEALRPSLTRWASSRLMRPILLALAYYVGARVGFLFQTAAVPQSVLWLPNSILLAVLLVSPPRAWPLLLIAAFPAQLLVAFQSGAPLLTMSLLFLTNCADAALGASLWRYASRGELRLEGLRPMLTFLVLGAAVPPLLLSFVDAAISVATGWGTDYWLAYTTRVRANVLTNAIFVPAAVALIGADRHAFWQRWRTRYWEAALLFLGLIATTWFAFSRPDGLASARALLYLPLPFLLWSAVRFGVGMTAAASLVHAYITIWITVRGAESAAIPPMGIVLNLQLQLLAVAVPVLCLAAVVQERERASSALAASRRALDRSVARLRDLGGKLLQAEEAERTRIARELHDDVGQRLAALGIALSSLKNRLAGNPSLLNEVTALQQQAMTAADGIRVLSHELHPAVLRHAGLLPAIRELCAHFDRREGMHAELIAEGVETSVPPEVALCVYRVTQEALHNVVRHAAAPAAEVRLVVTDAEVELTITDEGRGFDEDEARRRGGLGLTSIDERVRLVGGTVDLTTSPGHGTRITVRVPHGDRPH
jgi:two-component system, NarL family, sensor histidine kinase UhpB